MTTIKTKAEYDCLIQEWDIIIDKPYRSPTDMECLLEIDKLLLVYENKQEE